MGGTASFRWLRGTGRISDGSLKLKPRNNSMTFRQISAMAAAALLASCASTPKPAAFDIGDANGNGTLSKEEFEALMSSWTFKRYDANKDGKVTFEEWKAADPTADMATFRKLDANGAGFVTLEEGLAAVRRAGTFNELFDAIDVNKDGVIDQAEANAYGQVFSESSTNNFPGMKRK